MCPFQDPPSGKLPEKQKDPYLFSYMELRTPEKFSVVWNCIGTCLIYETEENVAIFIHAKSFVPSRLLLQR